MLPPSTRTYTQDQSSAVARVENDTRSTDLSFTLFQEFLRFGWHDYCSKEYMKRYPPSEGGHAGIFPFIPRYITTQQLYEIVTDKKKNSYSFF